MADNYEHDTSVDVPAYSEFADEMARESAELGLKIFKTVPEKFIRDETNISPEILKSINIDNIKMNESDIDRIADVIFELMTNNDMTGAMYKPHIIKSKVVEIIEEKIMAEYSRGTKI